MNRIDDSARITFTYARRYYAWRFI